MNSQTVSRKRPAPGTSPQLYQQQQPAANMNGYANDVGSQLSNDQFLQWGQAAQPSSAYQDTSNYSLPQTGYASNNAQISNQLTRRPYPQMTSTNPPMNINNNTAQYSEESQPASVTEGEGAWGDDIEALEQRAQVAKREAQARRKQIPPFVQKLNR